MRKPKHETCAALITAIDAYIEKADESLADELKKAGYANTEEVMEGVHRIEEAVAAALGRSYNLIAASVAESVDLNVWLQYVKPGAMMTDALAEEIARTVVKEFSYCMPKLVESYSTQIDAQAPIRTMTTNAASFIRGWSKDLGELMKLDQYKGIEQILLDGIQTGDSVPNVARKIRQAGIRDKAWKARRVALTEMLRASSVAQQDAMTQSPACVGKRWRHTGSRKNEPRPNHVEMNGQEVLKNEPFELIGRDGETYHPMYPRDPSLPAAESVNCHCIMQMVTDPNIFALPPEERRRIAEQARKNVQATEDEWSKELTERAKEESRRWHEEHNEKKTSG